MLLKLMIVPVLVALMSLAARRFGPKIGGLLIGLPWMTGPVILFLGLDRGEGGAAYAARLACGALLATVSIAAYALVYGWLSQRFRWPLSLTGGVVAYALVGLSLSDLAWTPVPAALLGGSCLLAASFLIPAPRKVLPARILPWWDIPVRMLASAALVSVIALVSDQLGATAAGIVASFPVLLTVIGTFTHHQWGSDALRALLRGITLSLLSFVMFFWVVGTFAVTLGLPLSYVIATAAALGVSASLIVVNQRTAAAVRTAELKAVKA
jgi:uncharacterized membrane protein (GlpM family)